MVNRMSIKNFFIKQYKKKQKGLTLIETAMVLGVIAISMVGLSQMMADNARTTRVKASSDKLVEITEATRKYVTANYTALVGLAGTGAPIVIPVAKTCATCAVPAGPGGLPSLQGAGYLPGTFIDINTNNQNHAVLIREPSANNLEIIITAYGGQAFPDDDLGNISGQLGSGGGGVYQNSPTSPSTQITGSYGGWSTATSTWNASLGGTSVRPSPGRPAVALAFAGAAGAMDDYLNRYNTGDPEANRMRTNIDMNGFDINNANVVRSNYFQAAVDVTAGRDIIATRDLGAGRDANVTRNVNAGNNVSAGNVNYSVNNTYSTNGVVYAASDSTSYGQVQLRRWGLLNNSGGGDIYIEPDDGEELIMTPNSWNASGRFRSEYNNNWFRGYTDSDYAYTRSGAYFCTGNASDCRVNLSDDGYFADYNDGYTTLRNNNQGLRLTGPGNGDNLRVEGQSNHIGVVYNQSTTYTYGLNQNYGNIAMSASDAVLYSNGFGTMDLIGTYSGWDRDAIYIGGYNRYNAGTGRRTRRVRFGGGANGVLTIDLQTGAITSGAIYTPILYDANDPNFYVDPNSTTRIRSLILTNRNGSVPVEHLLPNFVAKASYFVGYNNYYQGTTATIPTIPKPSCPSGGVPKVIVTPANVSAVYNPNWSLYYQPFYTTWTAKDAGGNWQIIIDASSSNRDQWQKPILNPAAIAMTYCYYP